MNATSIAPPVGAAGFGMGSPLRNVDVAPVSGSTRAMVPSRLAGTYRASSGPMVLPVAPVSPDARRTGVGLVAGVAFATDGAVIASSAATRRVLRVPCMSTPFAGGVATPLEGPNRVGASVDDLKVAPVSIGR